MKCSINNNALHKQLRTTNQWHGLYTCCYSSGWQYCYCEVIVVVLYSNSDLYLLQGTEYWVQCAVCSVQCAVCRYSRHTGMACPNKEHTKYVVIWQTDGQYFAHVVFLQLALIFTQSTIQHNTAQYGTIQPHTAVTLAGNSQCLTVMPPPILRRNIHHFCSDNTASMCVRIRNLTLPNIGWNRQRRSASLPTKSRFWKKTR
jgi:hypothetical protein